MGEKIVIGPINKGLKTNRTPFVIDNDSFPTLINAYQWRGRAKRKRGTEPITRLCREVDNISLGNTNGAGALSANILTTLALVGQPDATLTPGMIFLFTPAIPTQTFRDSNSDSVMLQITGPGYVTAITGITLPTTTTALILDADPNYTIGQSVYISGVTGMTQINTAYYVIVGVNPGVSITVTTPDNSTWNPYIASGTALRVAGSVNYATGAVSIQTVPALAVSPVFANVCYYPALPVMGLKDFVPEGEQYPDSLAFDTMFSYNIPRTEPYQAYDVSFYKNPTAPSLLLPGYTPKAVATPLTWHGNDYQQFWSTNFEGAFWETNGITKPFTTANIGMQFQAITVVDNITVGPPAVARLHFATPHNLVVGDFVFVNEVVTTTGINFQTGYVTNVAALFVDVTFPFATINTNGTGGICQYLTNTYAPLAAKDPLRWYDGDPTIPGSGKGWVNFSPPLSFLNYIIADNPQAQYYLVGARMIAAFKDRLLFFGPVIQTSKGQPIYLPDTVIYSQDGTPFYTCSYTNSPSAVIDTPYSSSITFSPTLTPINQTSTAPAFFEDITGFGGFISSGYNQPITMIGANEDVIIVGFSNRKARLVYTSNDIIPFQFFVINSEMGSASTFSSITLDRGVLDIGNHGLTITSQVSSQRVDLDIPDQIFELGLLNQGAERVCSGRDFVNEWIYFTCPSNSNKYVYPTQTIFYNYRDESWGTFYEMFTTYGQFRKITGNTWATIGKIYSSWSTWNTPWNSGSSTLEVPEVIGGNTQGYVIGRTGGTAEAPSLAIQSIAGNVIVSNNHCLNSGDTILITGCLGTIGPILNGKVFTVLVTATASFIISFAAAGTYLGGGEITRLFNPVIQTKQFSLAWGDGRKTRVGAQRYLFTKTASAQITLQIFLSQDGNQSYNDPTNDTLVYSDVLFTSPNMEISSVFNLALGLLGIPPSLTVNITLPINLVAGSVVITIGSIAIFTDDGNEGFTATGTGITLGSSVNYITGAVVLAFSVAPNQQPSLATYEYTLPNIQNPIADQQAQLWQRMNTSLIGDTIQFGFTMTNQQMLDPTLENQVAEIELHSIILDVTPSSLLA